MRHRILAAPLLFLAAACQGQAPATAPPAPSPAPVAPDLAGDFDARGTEPFWSLQVRPTQITLQRLDRPNLVVGNPGVVAGPDRVSWTSPNGPSLSIVIVRGDCSDGMSDLTYRYRAEIRIDGDRLEGCAFRTEEPPEPPA